MEQPKRAITLELDMHADTRGDMAHALRFLANEVEGGHLRPTTIEGGNGRVEYLYSYCEAEQPTHDEYIAQCDARL